MKKSIQLVWIVVADFQKALKFYGETVGLELKESNEEFGWAEFMGEDGAILGIAQADEHSPIPPGSNAVVTLTVDDLQEAMEELRTKQVEFVGEVQEVPGHVKLLLFKDVDGNYCQLVEILDKHE